MTNKKWTVTNGYGALVATFDTPEEARQYLADNDAMTDKLGRGYLYTNAGTDLFTGHTPTTET